MAEQVMKLGLPGISTVREYGRYYPAGEVTAHVIGFTDVDDQGQEGIEAAFDHWLKGENGSKRVMQDRRGQVFDDVELLSAPRPGRDLRTSIDLRLQYLAYRELKAAVTSSRARSGSVVVLDPRTGEVLAMVNQPSYNPNDRSQYRPDHYRNRAVTDIFEPGSTFKPFVMAEAVDSGDYDSKSIIDSRGALIVNDRVLTEEGSDLGRVSLSTVLAQSSNVGAARIALTRKPHAIWDMLSGFGIGRLTDSAFPGESAGTLNDPQHWRTVGQATLSYGYGVNVTALQLARAYGAIAAGGTLKPVSLLALDESPKGQRVISAETAHELTTMLEAVVSPGGTGQRAAVRNFHVAGKTGTSRKAAGGGYSKDHSAIFAGFAPASQPRLVVVVMIDEPQGDVYYGGDVAAPVFANVTAGAMRLMSVAPDDLARVTPAVFAGEVP
jgi:cell division protein FtsI (penicillin-binding protein 3)